MNFPAYVQFKSYCSGQSEILSRCFQFSGYQFNCLKFFHLIWRIAPTLLIYSLFSLGFCLSLRQIKISFPFSSTSVLGRHKIKPVAEGERWTGKLSIRGFPSSVKKPPCVEYQCLLNFSSARHLCHSLCNNHLSPLCFLIVHPPSTPLLSPHPCSSPVIPSSLSLFLAPLLWFFLPLSSHHSDLRNFRSYRPTLVASLSWGVVMIMTGEMDDWQGLVRLF